MVSSSSSFLDALHTKASGTSGRKRIMPEAFLDLRIPLPSLDEQKSIVASYRTALMRATELEREARAVETQATEAFETALGFDPPKPLPDRPVFVASFKDLDRWSHEGILRAALNIKEKELKFPIVGLGTVGKVSYGLQKSPANRPGTHLVPICESPTSNGHGSTLGR